jgi:hypothetical protein
LPALCGFSVRISSVVWPVLLATALFGAAMAGLLAQPVDETLAQGPDTADVVVQFSSGDVTVKDISFSEPISGLAALKLTGLEVITEEFGFGIAVCSIEGVGCPASDCFCDPTNFWNYQYWDGSAWQDHQSGATTSVISDTAVEGWAWGPFVTSPSPAPVALAANAALDWLRTQQSPVNGGYGPTGEAKFSGSGIDVLIGVNANSLNGKSWRRYPGSPSLFSYVFGNSPGYAKIGPAEFGKLAVGLAAADDACWPVTINDPAYNAATGAFSVDPGRQAWTILGMRALERPVPVTATEYLKGLAKPGGGWAWFESPIPTQEPEVDGTALVIQALVAAGEPLTSPAIVDGLNFLAASRNESDGGFPNTAGGLINANSTAYAIQAIIAAEQDPLTGTWGVGGSNPVDYLIGLKKEDGSIAYRTGLEGDLLATRQAVPALLRSPLPTRRQSLPACPASYFPVVMKN